MERIDKVLWMMRLAKTRSKAQDLIQKGMVQINGVVCKKSSSTIKVNDVFGVKHVPIWKTYKILNFPKSRVGAKLLPEHLIETTSADDLATLARVQKENQLNKLVNPTGRPTKKNRREIDDFFN